MRELIRNILREEIELPNCQQEERNNIDYGYIYKITYKNNKIYIGQAWGFNRDNMSAFYTGTPSNHKKMVDDITKDLITWNRYSDDEENHLEKSKNYLKVFDVNASEEDMRKFPHKIEKRSTSNRELTCWEQYYIRTYNSKNPNIGYNNFKG